MADPPQGPGSLPELDGQPDNCSKLIRLCGQLPAQCGGVELTAFVDRRACNGGDALVGMVQHRSYDQKRNIRSFGHHCNQSGFHIHRKRPGLLVQAWFGMRLEDLFRIHNVVSQNSEV